jgi:hypothetical protein
VNRLVVPAALAALVYSLAGPVGAADLTLVQDRSGALVAFARGAAGFHRLPLGVSRPNQVQLGSGMARVRAGRVELLVGAADGGVVVRRVDQELGTIRSIRMGDRLALLLGRRGWVAYAVGAEGIHAITLDGTLSVGEVRGDMAYIRVGGKYAILAATPAGVAIQELAQRPQQVKLARSQILTGWSGGKYYLHAPGMDSVETVEIGSRRPQQVWLGGIAPSGAGAAAPLASQVP